MSNIRTEQLLDFLEADPHDAFLLFALAQEYLKTGDLQKAHDWLHKFCGDRWTVSRCPAPPARMSASTSGCAASLSTA